MLRRGRATHRTAYGFRRVQTSRFSCPAGRRNAYEDRLSQELVTTHLNISVSDQVTIQLVFLKYLIELLLKEKSS